MDDVRNRRTRELHRYLQKRGPLTGEQLRHRSSWPGELVGLAIADGERLGLVHRDRDGLFAARERPLSLGMREMRSDAVHRLLLTPRGEVLTLEDIASLPDLSSWNREAIDVAVADLVAQGILRDDEYGRPMVRPLTAAA